RDEPEGSLDHQAVPSALANKMWLILGLKRASSCAYDFQVSTEAVISPRIRQLPPRFQEVFGSSAANLENGVACHAT
ncbi:MAG TPA: hypothetical protein VII41_11880, partial [Steroidobacteraceae bacterium]